MKTPSRRAIGVCTSQENSITSKVTKSECSRLGSPRAPRQLLNPAGRIGPSPSHWVKLSASTPTRGTTAKHRKTARAGSAIQATGPCCPARTSRRRERAGRGWGSLGGHVPIVLFMLAANCAGLMLSWNSLPMLSSSAVAWAGGSAWSHDWANTEAWLEVS